MNKVSTEVLKWIENFLLPISIRTFYMSFLKYHRDNILDFENLPNMADQGVKFNFSQNNHLKNVEEWHLHFHKANVGQILLASKFREVD